VDHFLVSRHPALSRSRWQALIGEGLVHVDGQPVKANYRLKQGQAVVTVIPEPVTPTAIPQEINLNIVYEDQDLVVVNKPRGMVVHPAPGSPDQTLVNALLHHCGDLSGINGTLRPGIVHRLDKDTTGLLVVAKNDFAHSHLAGQIKNRTVRRVYEALVHGHVRQMVGTINQPIGRHRVDRKRMAVTSRNGREAITHYTVLEWLEGYTLLEARLETGRTHQIRVHMAYIGHPVVGDPKYGSRKDSGGLVGQALHAKSLGFIHPRSGEYMDFYAPLPDDFASLLKRLGSKHQN